jgi:hypothetical protein
LVEESYIPWREIIHARVPAQRSQIIPRHQLKMLETTIYAFLTGANKTVCFVRACDYKRRMCLEKGGSHKKNKEIVEDFVKGGGLTPFLVEKTHQSKEEIDDFLLPINTAPYHQVTNHVCDALLLGLDFILRDLLPSNPKQKLGKSF